MWRVVRSDSMAQAEILHPFLFNQPSRGMDHALFPCYVDYGPSLVIYSPAGKIRLLTNGRAKLGKRYRRLTTLGLPTSEVPSSLGLVSVLVPGTIPAEIWVDKQTGRWETATFALASPIQFEELKQGVPWWCPRITFCPESLSKSISTATFPVPDELEVGDWLVKPVRHAVVPVTISERTVSVSEPIWAELEHGQEVRIIDNRVRRLKIARADVKRVASVRCEVRQE